MSSPSRFGRAARGFTMVELMITMAVLVIVMGGAMFFMVTQTQFGRRNFLRIELQNSARSALSIMAREIAGAGLGLPHRLAVRSLDDPGASALSCGTTPELSVASIDPRRQWTVSAADGSTITLADATPVGAADAPLAAGQWLFLYNNPTVDTVTGLSGHGLVRVGAARAAGSTSIGYDDTNYSALQSSLDLTQAAFNGGIPGSYPTAVMLADVSTFGVNCTDAAHPYLYWTRNGETVPLVSSVNLDDLTADEAAMLNGAAGAPMGLRFRFFVDTDADGLPDDADGDLRYGPGDVVAAPASLDQIVGVEITLRLRSDERDPSTGEYATADFVQNVMLTNARTLAGTPYIFVGTAGLQRTPGP